MTFFGVGSLFRGCTVGWPRGGWSLSLWSYGFAGFVGAVVVSYGVSNVLIVLSVCQGRGIACVGLGVWGVVESPHLPPGWGLESCWLGGWSGSGAV